MVILVRNEGPQSGTIRIVLTCGNPGTNSGFRRTGRDVRAAALQRQVHRARVQRQRHLAPVEGPCRAQQAKHFGHGQSVVFRQRFAVDGVQYLLASAKCQDHGFKKNQRRVILRLRIPGTIPGGYPEYLDQLRGGFLIVGVKVLLPSAKKTQS